MSKFKYFEKILIILMLLQSSKTIAQSFNNEKTTVINYVKRVYDSSPFEGVKKIEGDDSEYYAVAVSYLNVKKDSILTLVSKAQRKAELLSEQGFSEPCVNFEMVTHFENGNRVTYLFFCSTLSQFIADNLKQKLFDGARIISSPSNKYIIAVVSLENVKYSSSEMKDKIAHMKAKQFVNSMVNGSTITADQIIRTDLNDTNTVISNIEIIKEHSQGYVKGLELLFSKEIVQNKTTYLFYSKI